MVAGRPRSAVLHREASRGLVSGRGQGKNCFPIRRRILPAW
jgi:hypothetical protein